MNRPARITLDEWEARYRQLMRQGLNEPPGGGPLSRHVRDGDTRLRRLRFDNSPAALALWNLLLSENDRLCEHKQQGKKIVAAMKDLGTVPVMALAFERLTTFYPDGAWWTPCLMEQNEGLFELAERHGLDESFCPVRAMLGAFLNGEHFPRPDLLISSAGAVCDDFAAIAQRLEHMGFAVRWWEIPRRRTPALDEPAVTLPTGFIAPRAQVDFVRRELQAVARHLETAAGSCLTDAALAAAIGKSNEFRRVLDDLRQLVYTAPAAPLGSLEMLIAEMLALHFCSDYDQALIVLQNLLHEVQTRIAQKAGVLSPHAARVFWINPVADLRAMNLLEECGGRVCGTDYLFAHALDPIPEAVAPFEALARTALADPMVGAASDRAERIVRDIRRFGAEGVILSRIPGASHCAAEGAVIRDVISQTTGLPAVEIEIPTLCDAAAPAIRTRLEALIETILKRRQP